MELYAEGPAPGDRLRVRLEAARVYTIGRSNAADVLIRWDRHVSRRHAEVTLDGRKLEVRRLAPGAGPLFYAGRQVDSCMLEPGEHFVLGGTRIVFDGARPPGSSVPSGRPVEQVTFSREALAHVRYRDPDRRIEVLAHLPEVIWGARNDTELYVRLVNLLLAGISQADAAGIVSIDSAEAVDVLQWDRRRETAGVFRPSRRLVVEAVARRKQSVLHVWESAAAAAQFTATQEFDWAFCTPVPSAAYERLALYVGGRFDRLLAGALGADGGHLQADVKFAELVAEIVGSVRRLNLLERRQAVMRQFLPPVVHSTIAEAADMSLLKPRESDVTVMFCDLRGFSRQTETSRGDLPGLLDRVSQALGVMTSHIREHGGAIGAFQGDAAMGFWGWPVAAEDDPLYACRAALAIRAAFAEAARTTGHPLADFRMGIGMARGRAVAGQIGTSDHSVITAFGPPVNLASRLEGLTKQLRVPIIIDESLAEVVRARLPETAGRARHLARVLPYGMETPLVVDELLPSEADLPELTSAHLAAYDTAVAHFIAGRWDEAYACLRTLPSSDQAQDFLALHIAQHNRVAPADWNGIIRLPGK